MPDSSNHFQTYLLKTEEKKSPFMMFWYFVATVDNQSLLANLSLRKIFRVLVKKHFITSIGNIKNEHESHVTNTVIVRFTNQRRVFFHFSSFYIWVLNQIYKNICAHIFLTKQVPTRRSWILVMAHIEYSSHKVSKKVMGSMIKRVFSTLQSFLSETF